MSDKWVHKETMVPEPEDISDNLLNLSIRSKEEMGYSEERFDNGKSNKIQENCKIKYIQF